MRNLNVVLFSTFVLCAGFSFTSCSDDDNPGKEIDIIPDDVPQAVQEAKGFWVVNEDWFGHDNGTVNFFKQMDATNYEAAYRVYRAANDNEQLGVTTQYGAVWGDNIYLISKQGNRLVVADAATMAKKAVLTEIGGDGRGFVGINDKKAYVGHSGGIAVLDIESLSISKQIEGVSDQIGMMGLAANRVFAIAQRNGIYVINPETDEVENAIEGSFNTLTISKDGNVWVAGGNGFLCIDPVSLERTEIPYPEEGGVGSSWGAWNAGSLCASTQHNVIYWTAGGGMFGGGKKVVKYDIDQTTSATIYELGLSDEGTQLEFYGAGLRVDPLTDNLILTVKHSGWGASGAYNWIYKLDNAGAELSHFAVKGDNGSGASWAGNAEDWDDKYFWSPAMPVFEDANKPQILLNQIILTKGETLEIDLSEKIVDYDNTFASIQISVAPADETLANTSLDGHILKVTAGTQTEASACKISVLSNGVRIDKNVQIIIKQ